MGLLTTLLHGMGGRSSRAQTPSSILFDVITGLMCNPKSGGLQGLVNQFNSQGLGDVMSSWISTGQNQPIAPDQVKRVLGQEQVQGIASQMGTSTEDASQSLAQLLPQVVDKLTPDGNLPSDESLGECLGSIKKLLGG